MIRWKLGDLPDGFFIEDDRPGLPVPDRERVLGSVVSAAEVGNGLSIPNEVATAHGWEFVVTEVSCGGAPAVVTGVAFADWARPGTPDRIGSGGYRQGTSRTGRLNVLDR